MSRKNSADLKLPLGGVRWWLFLLGKTALARFLVFAAGRKILVGLRQQFTVDPLGGPALLWFRSAVLFLSLADQQGRCRVCLRYLAFPIRIGCPGCLFLNWSGTELLCPEGHGALYVPHHASCRDEAERWVALEI